MTTLVTDDEAIVELYQPQTEPPSSIVATVGELRQLGYWSQHLQWRYAKGELADSRTCADRRGLFKRSLYQRTATSASRNPRGDSKRANALRGNQHAKH